MIFSSSYTVILRIHKRTINNPCSSVTLELILLNKATLSLPLLHWHYVQISFTRIS